MAKKQANRSIQSPAQLLNRYPIGKLYDVFLSYSRHDLDFALQLRNRLTQTKLDIFLDQSELAGGDVWPEELKRGIEGGSNFVFIISPKSVISQWCQRELDYAFENNKRVVPVIYFDINESDIPLKLQQLQTIYFNRNSFEAAFEQLRAVLEVDRPWVKEQSRMLVEARRWESRPKDGSILLRGKELREAEAWLSQSGSGRRPPREQLGLEAKFIEASRKQEIRRQRQLLSIATVVSIVLAGLAIVAVIFAITAEERRVGEEKQRQLAEQRSRVSQAQALAANSQAQLEIDPERSILLAMEAISVTRQAKEPVVPPAPTALYSALGRSQLRAVLPGHNAAVLSAEYSRDGRYLVSSDLAGKVILWDAQTRQILQTIQAGSINGVLNADLSPDSRYILTPNQDGIARIWEAQSGKLLLQLKGHTKQISQATYSFDGRQIVTASDDGTAIVWDAQSGQPRLTLKGHQTGVASAAFSPDGRSIATAGFDKTVRIWDAQSGQSRLTIGAPNLNLAFNSVRFSPDNRFLVTGAFAQDQGFLAIIWDSTSGQLRTVLRGHTGPVADASFSPDGAYVLTASWDNTARLWSASTGQPLTSLTGPENQTTAAAFSPDGHLIVTANRDEKVRMWDVSQGLAFNKLFDLSGQMYTIQYSPDGRSVVTGGNDQSVKIWDVASGQLRNTLKGHSDFVLSVAYSPDGRAVVSGSKDGTARVWNTESGQEQAVLKGHKADVTSVSYSPDGRYILTGSYDGTAGVWDAKTGQLLRTIEHKSQIESARYSPDGHWVITAGDDGMARIWNAENGQARLALKPPGLDKAVFGRNIVWEAVFNPDGRSILTSSSAVAINSNNTRSTDTTTHYLKVWDADSGQERFELKVPNLSTAAAGYSPDGRTIATISYESVYNTLRLWNSQTGELQTTIPIYQAHSLAFNPLGTAIITANLNGVASVIPVDIDSLIQFASTRVTRTLTRQERLSFGLASTLPIFNLNL